MNGAKIARILFTLWNLVRGIHAECNKNQRASRRRARLGLLNIKIICLLFSFALARVFGTYF